MLAVATACHDLVHRPAGKLRLRFHVRPSQTSPPLPMNQRNQRNRGFEGFVGFEGALKKVEMFFAGSDAGLLLQAEMADLHSAGNDPFLACKGSSSWSMAEPSKLVARG